MKSDPPFDKRYTESKTAAPFGRSPDGHWMVFTEGLPKLPIPRHVAVSHEFIFIDGWVFPLSYVSKSFLVWFQASFLRWMKEDGTKKNKEWIAGIVGTFEDGLAGKL